ncbi:MAG: hypothetical protein V3U72_02870 [Candidatus Aenigmarchaeota archaeon]
MSGDNPEVDKEVYVIDFSEDIKNVCGKLLEPGNKVVELLTGESFCKMPFNTIAPLINPDGTYIAIDDSYGDNFFSKAEKEKWDKLTLTGERIDVQDYRFDPDSNLIVGLNIITHFQNHDKKKQQPDPALVKTLGNISEQCPNSYLVLFGCEFDYCSTDKALEQYFKKCEILFGNTTPYFIGTNRE